MSDNSWQPPSGPSEGDDTGPDNTDEHGAEPAQFGQQLPPSPAQPPGGPTEPVWREPEVELWWEPPAAGQSPPQQPTQQGPYGAPQQPGWSGEQPVNPWQAAFPAADQGSVHPATQSPYGSRPVEGVPPGWQFPPPVRPGQAPGGPAISLPRGAFGTPPRRRTRKGLIAVLAALAVLVAGTGGAIALRSRSGDDPNATGGTTPATEQTPSPTPTPTPTPTPSPTPKPTPPKPKPKPRPKPPTPLQVVAQNKIYWTGRVLASRCKEPGVRPTSYANVRKYYTQFLPCLNRTWYPAITEAGARYRPPKLLVFGGTITTPCGRTSTPFYCGANEMIYMPWPAAANAYRTNQVFARATMALQIAHEYGHHVQLVTGILQASFIRSATMRSAVARQQESRRRELQATCFGSVYLGADKAWFPVSGQMATMWRFVITHMGDEYDTRNPKVRDHGSRSYNGFWSMRGFNSINPGLCNTFTASPKATS